MIVKIIYKDGSETLKDVNNVDEVSLIGVRTVTVLRG